jgi:hypothetical protein
VASRPRSGPWSTLGCVALGLSATGGVVSGCATGGGQGSGAVAAVASGGAGAPSGGGPAAPVLIAPATPAAAAPGYTVAGTPPTSAGPGPPGAGSAAVSTKAPTTTSPRLPTALRPGHGAAPGLSTWTVRPGDDMWSIAEAVVAAADDRTPPLPGAVARYWVSLISANRGRLPTPEDPSLLFVGDVLVLPSLPPAVR